MVTGGARKRIAPAGLMVTVALLVTLLLVRFAVFGQGRQPLNDGANSWALGNPSRADEAVWEFSADGSTWTNSPPPTV